MRIWIAAATAALISTGVLASTAGAAPALCVSASTELSQRSVVPPCQIPPPYCPAALPVTDPVSGVGTTSATLNGRILSWTGDARWHFEWGTVPLVYNGR